MLPCFLNFILGIWENALKSAKTLLEVEYKELNVSVGVHFTLL
jgi:hypothetical protein